MTLRPELNSAHHLRKTVDQVPIDDLKLPTLVPRQHPERKLQMLTRSIKRWGIKSPLLVTKDGLIVCGVARLEAARRAGLKTVPVLLIDDLSDGEIEAYRIADNRLCELGSWNKSALAEIFLTLDVLEIEFNEVGFEIAEADLIIGEAQAPSSDEDEAAEEPVAETLLRLGDVFTVKDHLIICGDARAPETIATLQSHGEAAVVFTDPPYNCPVDGFVTGNGRHKHNEFAMASGEMTDEQFLTFNREYLASALQCLAPGALLYICMDWRNIDLLIQAAKSLRLDYINLAVFCKTNAGMGSLYRSQHELIAIFRKPGAQHRNNVQLGRFGRNRSNVWQYAGANAFGKSRDSDLAMHPTVKPVALVADAILDCTKRGDIVLDLFGGSGTTLIAAERTGRRAHLVEISPRYVETALRRFERQFGVEAVHVETGLSLTSLIEARREGAQPLRSRPPRRRGASNSGDAA